MELFSAKVNFKYSLNQQIHTKNTGLWVRIPLITNILTHNVQTHDVLTAVHCVRENVKKNPQLTGILTDENRDSNSQPIDYESRMITITPQ